MKKITFLGLIFSLFWGCTEPFEIETQGFEGVLVVNARLTNEEKQHEILLSRARPFEIDSVVAEQNATVSIVENSGTVFEFEEMAPGRYFSRVAFSAKANESYQLMITTSSGGSYVSSSETMPENVPIANLEAKRQTNDLGEEGVAIVLNNSSLGNQPNYFRFDYEETYKIIAPNWDPFEFEIIDDVACTDGDDFEVGIKQKTNQDRICYGQRVSTDIILSSTADLESNTLSDFLIRFIGRDNFILSHRYSVIVNQYSQSVNAHSYYQTLKDFNSSENIFSETQPGFISGNMVSTTDSEEKVIGYFEMTAVNSNRIFFNYEDLFPGEPLPEYPISCATLGNPRLIPQGYHCTEGNSGICDGNCDSPLIEQIKENLIVFAAEKAPTDFLSPFLTLPRACGDCTVLGSNIVPDFWIE